MAADNFKVAIAGGGIGGIATAIALATHGIPSRVFERRATFPEEGAGIQIGPNGTHILGSLGVADLLRRQAATPDALSVRDGATARELTRLPLGSWIAGRHTSPYWTAHRKDLHVALRQRADADPLITLTTGVDIVSVIDEGADIRAVAANGETFNASILVAADGIWSKLRQHVTADALPQPIGKIAFRSVTPADALPTELAPNAVHIWLAPDGHVVHYPVNHGRDIALVIIADDDASDTEWDLPSSNEAAQQKVRSFAAPVRDLVAKAGPWRRWALHSLPELGSWSAGRTVLLGDAAHPVLPFLAQGAVLALEDATTLAACIAGQSNDIAAALRNYERTRRPRVRRVAEASRRNGRIYHMAGINAVARNTAMRLTPPNRVMAGFDWLYGWRP
jgi:salicylate hydroxylase